MFPGRSCFPLSVDDKSKDTFADNSDQLNVIFNVIGTPSLADIDSTPGYILLLFLFPFHFWINFIKSIQQSLKKLKRQRLINREITEQNQRIKNK